MSVAFVASIAVASTTISTNIQTDGTLAVTGASTLTGAVTVAGTATSVASTAGSSNGAPGGGGGGYNFITPPNTVQPVSAVVPTTVLTPATPAVQATVSSVTFPSYSFKKPLSPGLTSTDVKKLQEVLNADPETQISVSGAGSPGKESSYFGSATKKAVQKFQVKYKLAKPGDAAYGSVGPATRAKLTELGSGTVLVPKTSSTPAQTNSASATADIAKQLNDSLKMLLQLQEKLKTATN